MWNEIKDKAKFNLFKIYKFLCVEGNLIENSNNSNSSQDTDFNHHNPTLDMVFNRWKLIIELYIEHGFILID